MKKIKDFLNNPIHLLLAVLIVVISYMYLTNHSYNVGKEIGKELIVSYKK